MATLNWKHENTNTETLYLENELLGTVVKKQAKDDGNSQYLLTARVENTWWANDDLNAMDMPHAKQIAEMRIELTKNEMFNAYENQQFLWDRDEAKNRLSQTDDDTFDELTDAQFECVINQVAYEMRRQMDKYGYEQYDALDQAISIVKAMDLTPLYERCAVKDGACANQHLSIEPEADNTVPAWAAGEQPKEYWMWLHYGWEESVDDGIRHAFETSDPEEGCDAREIEKKLYDELEPDDHSDICFDWDTTHIKLPESLVKRIQADTAMGNQIVALSTFPDEDKNFCKLFSVPKCWLANYLEKQYKNEQQESVGLEYFLNNYIWDETCFVYQQAKKEGVLLCEREDV